MKRSWLELGDSEATEAWARFERDFEFNPSVHAENWPGIREPTPSETYCISKVYEGGESGYKKLNAELQQWGLRVFQELLPSESDWLFALDWQHACYRFFPKIASEQNESDEWTLPILPDGDYYLFLEPGFSWGIFGHPWEQTVCLFGAPLLAILERDRPELLTSLVRTNHG